MSKIDLTALVVKRVIFHDVPVVNKLNPDSKLTLSETETIVDAARRHHLRTRLIKVLGSKSAYRILFHPAPASPVPAAVRDFTRQVLPAEAFVAASSGMAVHLFKAQRGSVSSGLLCVLDAVVGAHQALVLMKLERESGARLDFGKQQDTGKRTFTMAVLDNLVLTEGTRLFKTALFVRTGADEDDFECMACDDQSNASAYKPMAQFWLEFLGCVPALDPRVATQRFFETTLHFINESVTDPVDKAGIYESLHSELRSSDKTFSPASFLSRHVPTEYRRQLKQRLHDENLLNTFTKDTADIALRLKRLALKTTSGVIVTVPNDKTDLVEVQQKRIIVKDELSGVER
jgi:hypothetical protein